MAVKDNFLYVVISCDADPDRPRFGGRPLSERGEHRWKGIEEGIKNLKNSISTVKDSKGNPPVFTWFLRSDRQMLETHGDYCWPATNFKGLWKESMDQGDEIGWHPHLWRWSNEHRTWFQEYEDREWIRECFLEGHRHLKGQFEIRTTRTGWDFHDNYTMNLLEELGLLADLSALPGFKNQSFVDGSSGLLHNYYDWMEVPRAPYHPSSSNYKDKGNLSILEIPHACFFQNRPFYLFRRAIWKTPLRRFMEKAPRQTYALMTSLSPDYFVEGARMYLKSAKRNPTIMVNYFHPDDLLDMKGIEGFDAIVRNIGTLARLSNEMRVGLKFATATEAAKIALGCMSEGRTVSS
jgi:hypothetical protein